MWSRFIVTAEADKDAILSILRESGVSWVPDISIATTTDFTPSHPAGEAAGLRATGIQCTLDEAIHAPPVVTALLCEQAGLDRCYAFRQGFSIEGELSEADDDRRWGKGGGG